MNKELSLFRLSGQRGKVKGIRVHKAVAETFIPNPDNLPIVHHKDNNKLNPDVSNLEWTTNKDNVYYGYQEQAKTTHFYNNRKLTDIDVMHIRQMEGKLSTRELAQMYGVSKTTISNIFNKKYYYNLSK